MRTRHAQRDDASGSAMTQLAPSLACCASCPRLDSASPPGVVTDCPNAWREGEGEGDPMKALMVYPKFPPTYWSYTYSLRFVGKKSLLPPLGLITVASLLPRDWRASLVDLNIESLSDREIRKADVVMLTGMQVQRRSLHE